MFVKALNWLVQNKIGEYASLLGLIITIIGFIITIYNVAKTRSASTEAKLAVQRVRKDLEWTDTVTILATSIAAMDEIKRLQRMNAWAIIPERYSNLRKSLITIRGTNPDLTEEEQKLFQSTITQFANFERVIEECLPDKIEDLNSAQINSVVSKQIDKIQEILVLQKKKIGRD